MVIFKDTRSRRRPIKYDIRAELRHVTILKTWKGMGAIGLDRLKHTGLKIHDPIFHKHKGQKS